MKTDSNSCRKFCFPRNKILIVFSIVSFSIQSVHGQFNRLDAATKTAVEQKMNQFLSSNGIIGASVGIIKNGEISYFKGFGYQDAENKIPATEYTMYRSGSICKSFTAVAVLQLYEQGKLDIQADVRNYVPEYPVKPQGTITAYRLLCHRSGIRHYEEYDTTLMLAYENTYYDFDAIAALDIFKNGTLKFQPGTAYNYTTFGYNLLGAVVERAGAQPFEFQVRDRIAHIADMPFVQPEYAWRRPYPNESVGYDYVSGPLNVTNDIVGIKYKVPGGGYILTAIDLTLFMKGLMDSAYFKDKSLVSWMTLDHSGGNNYGLGIFTEVRNGRTLLHHGGGGPKTYSWYMYYPDTNDGVVVMTNTYLSDVKGLCISLLDIIASASVSGAPYSPIPHALSAPALISPKDKDTVTTANVSFTWTQVPFAYTYRIEISSDSLFNSGLIDTVSSNTYLAKNLVADTRYFWRVQALNLYLYDTTTGNYSPSRSFYLATVATTIGGEKNDAALIYPNPFTGNIYLSGFPRKERSIKILTLQGAEIPFTITETTNDEAQIDLSFLPCGLYLLMIKEEDGRNTIRKLVKE